MFFTVGFTAIYGELPRTFCQVGMGKISYASWGGGGSRDSHLQCAVGLRPISQRRDVGPPGFAQKVANSHLVISTGAQRSGETPVFCLRWNRSLHATPLRIATKRDFLCKAVAPGWMRWFWVWGFGGGRVVAGRGRRFSRFGCACAPACDSVEHTHAAKARHEWRHPAPASQRKKI